MLETDVGHQHYDVTIITVIEQLEKVNPLLQFYQLSGPQEFLWINQSVLLQQFLDVEDQVSIPSVLRVFFYN